MNPHASLPSGTVTFLFTDIEGSTRLWEQHPEAMRLALARHDALLRAAIEANGGHVFKTMGDQFCAAFATVPDALEAALTAQRAVYAENWGEVGPLRVRLALHTGAAEMRDGDYFGPPLNRVARLLQAGHGGQILLSQATWDRVRDAPSQDVSVRDLGRHRLKDLQEPEHLFQLLAPDLPADFPPLRSLEAFAHNLPRQLTSFIGRQREIAEIEELLATTPLLTLTGAGGCGKTRLALQVAADRVEEFAEGAWLVELAALSDPGLVPQTIASTLGVREEPGRPVLQTLTSYLRTKSLLLLLDNCEHLIGACAGLAETLLRSCPGLKILATSREALGIGGETPWRVPPLSVPDPLDLSRRAADLPVALSQYEASRLFIERAQSLQPQFAVGQHNAAAVAQVCQRLDGIPLAIELAAARVKAMPVEKIAERLDEMFRLLTGGSRTALPRQQTLRALIDWSYELLTEPEQALLRRLSVFAGGWTLEAAEAVCGDDGGPETEDGREDARFAASLPPSPVPRLPSFEVLDLLTSLVEKSLVQYEESGTGEAGSREARYRLLETVRQYARDRLLETGESEAVRTRHRDCFLRWAEQAEANLLGPDQVAWVERLEAEHDNLRAALSWCKTESGSSEGLFGLTDALSHFWLIRSHLVEGAEWLDAALERSQDAPVSVRARLLNARAWIAEFQGDFPRVATLSGESLPLARDAQDTRQIAVALVMLSRAAAGLDGDLERAASLAEEARALASLEGDRWSLLLATGALGHCRLREGEYEQAAALLEECLPLSREIGERIGGANCRLLLGKTALRRGDCARARAYLREGLAAFEELGDRWGTVGCLAVLALLAEVEREPARAATLLGAAEAMQEAFGVDMGRFEAQDCDRSAVAIRADLGEEAFAAAWAEGRAMTLEDATAYALKR